MSAWDWSYYDLLLPAGGLRLSPGALPVVPVPLADVPDLGAVEIPWRPERSGGGPLDLSQNWRLLLRRREAFAPWTPREGLPASLFDAYLKMVTQGRRPRAAFRVSADRRTHELLYPQLLPPDVCHRLGDEVDLDREPWILGRALVVRTDQLLLEGPDGCTAVVGRDALGARVAVRPRGGEPLAARRLPEAADLLARFGPYWTVASPSRARLHTLL